MTGPTRDLKRRGYFDLWRSPAVGEVGWADAVPLNGVGQGYPMPRFLITRFGS